MKILAISGSPRNGYCEEAINLIKQHFKNNCTDFKIIKLTEINILECKGCLACVKKGEEYCPLNDDRDFLIMQMLESDGLIIASPAYAAQVTSIMKKTIERISFFAHRPQFNNKYAMTISACCGLGAKETNKYLKKVFSFFGYNVSASLEIFNGVTEPNEEELDKIRFNTIEKANAFLHSLLNKPAIMPTLEQLIVFNIFKKLSVIYQDTMQADFKYYQFKKEFYDDAGVNPVKKIIARLVARGIK